MYSLWNQQSSCTKPKNGLLPTVVGNYFEGRNDYSMNPASRYKFGKRDRPTKIIARLTSSEKSIQIRGEKLWNEIPETIISKKSINSFKKHYKIALLREPDT